MALLWIEGFEGFGTVTNDSPKPLGAMARKYINISNEVQMNIEDGRIGGYCIELPNGSIFGTPILTVNNTLTCGCGFRNGGGTDYTLIAFFDGGSNKGINIRWESGTGEIDIWLNNSLIATSSGLGLVADTWYYAEMKVVTDQSSGSYKVDIGGIEVFTDSGIDTQPGSNPYMDRINFFGANSEPRWDDIYICDGTGSTNNDILGNVKVVAISPDGDDTANWGTSTPSANHYENVDENPADDDTSYVEDGTPNVTDLYDYEPCPSLGTIFGLQINTHVRETDATSFDMITPIESNGTQDDDAGQAVGGTGYNTLVRVSEEDPDTGNAWTQSTISAAKFGVKVV
jgi:hypothetical protein